MNNYGNPKSASTAGLLGIFLGSFGAHCWYLGDKKKGIIHVSLIGAAALLGIISFIVMPKDVYSMAAAALGGSPGFAIAGILSALAGVVASGNAIWGAIEGIMILSHGDAGLAAKGYRVNEPQYGNQYGVQYGVPYGQPQYGQPYGQPMQPSQPMQPMQQPTQQPMQPDQPMPPMNTQPDAQTNDMGVQNGQQ